MIEVVQADESHLPAMGELWWEFVLFHSAIDPWFTPRQGAIPGFLSQHAIRFMNSEDALALAAVDNGRVVGYSLSELKGPSAGLQQEKWGWIDQLAVAATHRRQGLGDRMVERTLAWFDALGVTRIELELTAANNVSYSFWRKHGFRDYVHRLYLERKKPGSI